MPITRTPWTDDDGTGTTGTIINNGEKQIIYNQIDEALAAPGLGGVWTDVPFDGANFWPGVAANHVLVNKFTIVNKVMIWIVNISGAPVPSSPYLYLTVPAGRNITACYGRTAHSFDGAIVEAYVGFGNARLIAVQKNAGGNWITGPIYTYFTVNLSLE